MTKFTKANFTNDTPAYLYCVARVSARTGNRTYAAKSRSLPEWRRPGHSTTGVGIDALLTWKTQAGAAKWAAQFTHMPELSVEVVS
jgi:hypothetical protein